jgi:hypothetical protein
MMTNMSWWLFKTTVTSSHLMAFLLGIIVAYVAWAALKMFWKSARFYGKLLVVGSIIAAIGLLLLLS